MNLIYKNTLSPEFETPASENTLNIWTDGSTKTNPGPCSAAAILRYKDFFLEYAYFQDHGTNNIGELWGIRAALMHGRELWEDLGEYPQMLIHTDSQYCLGVLLWGWKAKKNQKLIAEIKELLKEVRQVGLVGFEKVKGHAGIELNERADWIAGYAIRLGCGV